MRDERKEALDAVIDNKQIKTVFQPIISLKDGSLLGHEALSRITGTSLIKDPEMLFSIAGEYSRLWDLELLCRTRAFETAYHLMVPPYDKMLFINVNPNIMHDEKFIRGFTKDFLMEFNIEPKNVIFEITERNVIVDMGGFLSTISHYRSQNYKIAIDDAGAGYSGLNLISDINPNYIKLDMKLIRNVDTDNLKYALIKGMVELSRESQISLIAEGIETREELSTLVQLGVQYGQGYYIQRPSEEIRDIRHRLIHEIYEINYQKDSRRKGKVPKEAVINVCKYTGIVAPGVTADYVYNVFMQNPDFFGLSVVENEMPLGIITREKLALKMSGHYGYSLYQNKPIADLMDRDFLAVDYQTPINVVSYLAMSRPNDKLYDFIVVTENDRYTGTVTIKDLLQKATEIEVDNAKDQNPLSGLPGNLMVEQQLTQCVHDNEKYSVVYIDIDNFKAFNDVYGFENGDLIIKLLAAILKKNIPYNNFIGHIGGDDFVVIIYDHITEQYFDDIIAQFEEKALKYYSREDRAKGYIITANRKGELEHYPLLSITIAAVSNQKEEFTDVYRMTEQLAKKKKEAKQKKMKTILNKLAFI
ncbi:MAG TPA: GGDEF domain-containing protein [Clostridiales bacterium]|nr:GGDEF domain-containing protein [Clostridiales bacterium]